jgi:ParB-like nuclease domain
MASSKPKLVLRRSQDIPFNKLVLSQSNVWRVKAGLSIKELAEEIAHRGPLQGLNVHPILDADGIETGMFEIPAGGRRYRAQETLGKQKRMAGGASIPLEQGVLFTTYATPRTDARGERVSRAHQIVEWLGSLRWSHRVQRKPHDPRRSDGTLPARPHRGPGGVGRRV